MATRKKRTKRERIAREKRMGKRRQRQLTRMVGGKVVFGKKIKSRMLRLSTKYADLLLKRAHKAGLSVAEYTLRLANRNGRTK